MSATHRSVARLPLEIFEGFKETANQDQQSSAESMREAISFKLKNYQKKTYKDATSGCDGITTVGDLFTEVSTNTLMHTLDPLLTAEECETLLQRIASHCAATPVDALSLLHKTDLVSNLSTHELQGMPQQQSLTENAMDKMRYLPTGFHGLDACLNSGIRVGTITELVGRAGTGKSQLAMQLSVMAARYGQGSVYIDTEKKLSVVRLKQIAEMRLGASTHAQRGNAWSMQDKSRYASFLDNVTVHSPTSTAELLSVVDGIEEEILLRSQYALDSRSMVSQDPESSKVYPVRLVVLDSIAAPTRRDFGENSAAERATAIFKCAQTLKRLADQLHLAVLVINQAGIDRPRNVQGAVDASSSVPASDVETVKAALGTAWHHCVSTRILMEDKGDSLGHASMAGLANGNVARVASVVKSNLVGPASVQFKITNHGLSDLYGP